MRWKLIAIVSLGTGLIAFVCWAALALGFFGSARGLARHDWLLLASASIPLVLGAVAGFFLYRHTARKRKLQAVVTASLSVILTVAAYFVGWAIFPNSFYIPRANEVRHAR